MTYEFDYEEADASFVDYEKDERTEEEIEYASNIYPHSMHTLGLYERDFM